MSHPCFSLKVILVAVAIAGLSACDVVPKEAVTLSNTVGRDLEEVHRAHRDLAELHFSRIEDDINRFIDQTYRPAFVKKFAEEFRLAERVNQIVQQDPDKLLPVLTRFVETAVNRTEKKRAELLGPIQVQKQTVIEEIDNAHRQIQAAQAIVTGHLASVRNVREVQNELLTKVGLGDLREKIATKTADISTKVAGFIKTGEEIESGVDTIAGKIAGIDAEIDKLKEAVTSIPN